MSDHDEWLPGDFLCRHRRLFMSDIERLRDLGTLERIIEKRLADMEGEKNTDEENMLRERAILDAVQREIRKRGQMVFQTQFGTQ